MLETGEWQFEGNELVIKVAASATVIDMSLGTDAKTPGDCHGQRSTGQSRSSCKVLPGGVAQAAPARPRDWQRRQAAAARNRIRGPTNAGKIWRRDSNHH